ncbi:Dam family site-specific DNA-(adenine-N6)-methyltransferase [Zobellia sp. 1_MG-2023]|uniref:DNA adenine methylase n=1 Tax=Zobellia sp. 1_MG-2023 TaxID=3062626 RepID=UPI0026E21832|nr:Dam family site-specific DNA-(adenine-N6)-methyltransferase [Zobellia sp. 1_MG-2023]MDO6820214.1 Dam family site-specific DNA-(adenine-N6)-methyltransferase [Zobellia sp. 1_MG-2023]
MPEDILIHEEIVKCYPFLRWTGSKNWLVKSSLHEYLPKDFKDYHECFLGGGSVFFATKKNGNSFLYDLNKELIDTYVEIRDNVDKLIMTLKKLKNSEEEFYRIRNSKPIKSHTKAARFIYLNKCSFNGIYRVNSKGLYNVPYGHRKNVDVVVEENLRNISRELQDVNISCVDFEMSLGKIKKNDLVFLDPPYTVAHENNGFIMYNQKLFAWQDQVRLRNFIEQVIKKEAYFIMTNASHSSILDLYKGLGKTFIKSRYSKVGGRNKTRGMYNELIICNTV